MEALRPFGLEASPAQVAEAIRPLCDGRWAFRLASSVLDTIIREHRHQLLINRVAADGFKQNGYETRYSDIYPVYLEECQKHGFVPLSPKTFRNRALRRRTPWEHRPRMTATGNENAIPTT